MTDIIVLAAVVVILGLAVKGSIKHFKGESPCCGGGSGEIPEEEKTLTGTVLGTRVIHISGMHCDHCVNRVMRALNKLDGVSARVSLKKKEAVVSYDRAVDDEDLRRAVKNAGYEVDSIEAA